MTKTATVELGYLTTAHLGLVVSVEEGGSTHTGQLRAIHHDETIRGQHRTMISLASGEWRHTKTYPSETPCDLASEVPA